jgi:hypothetical protein
MPQFLKIVLIFNCLFAVYRYSHAQLTLSLDKETNSEFQINDLLQGTVINPDGTPKQIRFSINIKDNNGGELQFTSNQLNFEGFAYTVPAKQLQFSVQSNSSHAIKVESDTVTLKNGGLSNMYQGC